MPYSDRITGKEEKDEGALGGYLKYLLGAGATAGAIASPVAAQAGIAGLGLKALSDLDRLKKTTQAGTENIRRDGAAAMGELNNSSPGVFAPQHGRGGWRGASTGPQYSISEQAAESALDSYNRNMEEASRQKVLGVPSLLFQEMREAKSNFNRRLRGRNTLEGYKDAWKKTRADYNSPLTKLHHFQQFRKGVGVDALRGHQVAQILAKDQRKFSPEAWAHLTGGSPLKVMERVRGFEEAPGNMGMGKEEAARLAGFIRKNFLGQTGQTSAVEAKIRGAEGWNDKIQSLPGLADARKAFGTAREVGSKGLRSARAKMKPAEALSWGRGLASSLRAALKAKKFKGR